VAIALQYHQASANAPKWVDDEKWMPCGIVGGWLA